MFQMTWASSGVSNFTMTCSCKVDWMETCSRRLSFGETNHSCWTMVGHSNVNCIQWTLLCNAAAPPQNWNQKQASPLNNTIKKYSQCYFQWTHIPISFEIIWNTGHYAQTPHFQTISITKQVVLRLTPHKHKTEPKQTWKLQ